MLLVDCNVAEKDIQRRQWTTKNPRQPQTHASTRIACTGPTGSISGLTLVPQDVSCPVATNRSAPQSHMGMDALLRALFAELSQPMETGADEMLLRICQCSSDMTWMDWRPLRPTINSDLRNFSGCVLHSRRPKKRAKKSAAAFAPSITAWQIKHDMEAKRKSLWQRDRGAEARRRRNGETLSCTSFAGTEKAT
jgi:hypothetical protein